MLFSFFIELFDGDIAKTDENTGTDSKYDTKVRYNYLTWILCKDSREGTCQSHAGSNFPGLWNKIHEIWLEIIQFAFKKV